MAYLDSFTHKEAYSNQVEIPGIASIIHEDPISQATWGNHCELSATTILAVYRDVTNSRCIAVVGTRVSDFAIEWGTPVEFLSSSGFFAGSIIPVRVSDTKFLIVYQGSMSSNNDGTSIAGTVNGTVITFGTEAIFEAGSATPIGAVLMDTDKVMIAYADGSSNGQATIASLTGTSIAYGAVATFATINVTSATLTQLCKHSTTLASVVYRVSPTVTEVVTLSLSGTTITPNTAGKAAFGGSADIQYPSIGALDATKFVLAYTNVTDTGKGNAQIGTISGTTITAGASEYNFDATNLATRIPTVAVISSTLFAVSYGVSTVKVNFKVGSVAATAITFGTELLAGNSTAYTYSERFASTAINITYTKSGQLTFSYLTQYLNQFVCGMLTQNYRTLEAVPMCYKVAEAGAGEQVELSSLYLISNANGFVRSATLSQDYSATLYHNGTFRSNRTYSTSDNPVGAIASVEDCKRLGMANEPIILTENQVLYASIDTDQGTSMTKGSCNVFGLKRS